MTDVIQWDLGRIEYGDAWDLQESILKQGIEKKLAGLPSNSEFIENYLLLCQHPHVYTLGKHGNREHLIINDKECEQKGISFYVTNRGGDITYHGPGQLVAYPVLDLEQFVPDIRKYISSLEEVIIRLLKDYGIEAGRLDGFTGVWIEPGVPGRERKICAIGVKCSRWITIHGLAFNMNTDLGFFNHIIPCGITDKAVTGMDKELGHPVDEKEVTQKFCEKFSEVFGAKMIQKQEVGL